MYKLPVRGYVQVATRVTHSEIFSSASVYIFAIWNRRRIKLLYSTFARHASDGTVTIQSTYLCTSIYAMCLFVQRVNVCMHDSAHM